jgi:hypothetical protein
MLKSGNRWQKVDTGWQKLDKGWQKLATGFDFDSGTLSLY